MTKTAMVILLKWATRMPYLTQEKFATFYKENKTTYIFDEMLGGRFDSETLTSQMMMKMITDFESSVGMTPSFTEQEIYH